MPILSRDGGALSPTLLYLNFLNQSGLSGEESDPNPDQISSSTLGSAPNPMLVAFRKGSACNASTLAVLRETVYA